MEKLTVSIEEEALRLDKFLCLRFPDHSRTYFQFLITQSKVWINGSIAKKRQLLRAEDAVTLCFEEKPELDVEPQEMGLKILYEDEQLLVIDKPAGLVVHPAPGHPDRTLVNALLHHCKGLKGLDPVRPGIVHRLDKDTSGVLLAAKTPIAHAKLVDLFAQRRVVKTYLAICSGKPKEGLIDAPMRRHPTKRKEMAIDPLLGKPAQSLCRVLGYNEQLSLVEIQLLTGRTHQIRVHMKHLGTPVLGDLVYGSTKANQRYSAPRQLLHAKHLGFVHPFSEKKMEFTAPLPDDFWEYGKQFSQVCFSR